MLWKTRFRRFPGAEPCVFTCFFLSMFPKSNFLHAFREKSAVQAAIHWTTARPNQAKTTAKTQGFGNWLLKTIVKNQGSASVECANLVFCDVFLSLTWCDYESRKNAHESIGFLRENNESAQKRRKTERENTRFSKIMKKHNSKTSYFTRYSATRRLTRSQNATDS